ncbi:MAG: TIGR04076 family protein [Dehalococcoidales bacterium]|nr:TIGR04076 family protein [Dehalococcoidales bacterium]
MADKYDVTIKVIAQKGTCGAGHKIGDEWLVSGGKISAGICCSAFNVLYPHIRTLEKGGGYPWLNHKDVARTICIHPDNTLSFELRRVAKEK